MVKIMKKTVKEVDTEIERRVQSREQKLEGDDNGSAGGTDALLRKSAYLSTVPGDWRRHRRISFVGRKVNSAAELADLFFVYRHPRLEHFHIVYLDKFNRIVAHNAISSGLVDRTAAIDSRNPVKSLFRMDRRMERLNAGKLLSYP